MTSSWMRKSPPTSLVSSRFTKRLQQCALALVQHLDAAFVRFWTLNETTQMLELAASAGLYTHLDGAHARVPVGKFKIGRIAQECKPHVTTTFSPTIGSPIRSGPGSKAW